MYSRKLYATGSSSANNVANVQIPSRSRLLGIQFAAYANSVTDDSGFTLEISQASSNEIAVNASQQCIAEVRYFSNFVTSGLAQGGINIFVPVDVTLLQGQLVYLHSNVTGTISYTCSAILWLA